MKGTLETVIKEQNEKFKKITKDKEDLLVRRYLRKYINGFRASDIKALEKDCIKCDVSYHIVRRKIVEKADECR